MAAVVAVVAVGCGGSTEEATAPLPVAEAAPVPFEDSGLAPPSSPPPDAETSDDAAAATGAEDTSDPAATPSPSPTAAVGPTTADAAAFVAGEALADLGALEHVVVDLDDDTWPEVVAVGITERRGEVRVAWWTSEGYAVLAAGQAGRGRDVRDLRASDVNGDGQTELLVVVEGEGLASLAVWTVPRRGVIEALEAVGGCHDGSHVYGVTRARLVAQGEAPPAIVADCDDSPLPVADWSEQRWVWQQGAYRVVDPPTPDAGDDGDGEGRDDDGEGDDGGDDGGDGDDEDDGDDGDDD